MQCQGHNCNPTFARLAMIGMGRAPPMLLFVSSRAIGKMGARLACRRHGARIACIGADQAAEIKHARLAEFLFAFRALTS
jgi:hypothetical protein